MPDFVIYPNPILSVSASCRPLDQAMLAAGQRLLAAAQKVNAYGLAAAHIGLSEPVVVVSVATDALGRDYRVMYCPEVRAVAAGTAGGVEGSVSLPGIEVTIIRPVWAEVAYRSADDAEQVDRLEGLAARVALHEIDQMQGLFFLDRLSRLKRDAAVRKFEKNQRR